MGVPAKMAMFLSPIYLTLSPIAEARLRGEGQPQAGAQPATVTADIQAVDDATARQAAEQAAAAAAQQQAATATTAAATTAAAAVQAVQLATTASGAAGLPQPDGPLLPKGWTGNADHYNLTG